jgi:hypothetical protein
MAQLPDEPWDFKHDDSLWARTSPPPEVWSDDGKEYELELVGEEVGLNGEIL